MKISHLLFDLDNTLYPSSSQMDAGISRRMLECVQDFFHCDYETAVALKKKNIIHFSTTLEWLRSEGLTDTEVFFAQFNGSFKITLKIFSDTFKHAACNSSIHL